MAVIDRPTTQGHEPGQELLENAGTGDRFRHPWQVLGPDQLSVFGEHFDHRTEDRADPVDRLGFQFDLDLQQLSSLHVLGVDDPAAPLRLAGGDRGLERGDVLELMIGRLAPRS